VRVKIEGGVYPGVSEHLLDYLGIDVLGAKKGCAGVPKIVEADGVGETRLLEQRLKGAVEDVVAA
jgi:hypothetical protein